MKDSTKIALGVQAVTVATALYKEDYSALAFAGMAILTTYYAAREDTGRGMVAAGAHDASRISGRISAYFDRMERGLL